MAHAMLAFSRASHDVFLRKGVPFQAERYPQGLRGLLVCMQSVRT
jgi:hypothetical protein